MKQNDPLRDSLDKLKIQYNDEQIEQFRSYYELLTEWNKKINLTAITGYEDVVRKHFIDSILICSLLDLNKDIRIIWNWIMEYHIAKILDKYIFTTSIISAEI